MRVLATTGVLILLSVSARAQQAAAPAAHYMSAAEVAAGVKKLGNDQADVAYHVFNIPPYAVNAAHRAPVTQRASQHDANSELFMVMDGTATMVTGGTIVEPAHNGMNVTGKAIEGGARQKLAKGDFLIVPAGVPHMFADISPAGITVMQIYLPKTK